MTEQIIETQITVEPLKELAEHSGLEKSHVETLLNKFSGFVDIVRKVRDESGEIVVKSEEETEKMKAARVARLSLVRLRGDVETTRKKLKQQSLDEGKAIDGMANIIKALVAPIESHLEAQERFAEFAIAKRLELKFDERKIKLSPYVADINTVFGLKDMSDPQFEQLFTTSKTAFEAEQANQKRLQEEQIARDKAEAERQEAIRKENIKLKEEAAKRETEFKRKLEIQKQKAEKEKKAREATEKELRIKREAEEARKRKEEAELRAKEQAEKKAQADKEEAERKAMLAPDKEKLLNFAREIQMIQFPALRTSQAASLLDDVRQELEHVVDTINQGVKSL